MSRRESIFVIPVRRREAGGEHDLRERDEWLLWMSITGGLDDDA